VNGYGGFQRLNGRRRSRRYQQQLTNNGGLFMAVKKIISEEVMVVVLTQGNAIYCGWTTEPQAEVMQLRAARQAVYYSADTKGVLGLAANGPGKDSRIGPPADIPALRNISQVILCSPSAIRVWEEAKWRS
jgi:hypothetical protein